MGCRSEVSGVWIWVGLCKWVGREGVGGHLQDARALAGGGAQACDRLLQGLHPRAARQLVDVQLPHTEDT